MSIFHDRGVGRGEHLVRVGRYDATRNGHWGDGAQRRRRSCVHSGSAGRRRSGEMGMRHRAFRGRLAGALTISP